MIDVKTVLVRSASASDAEILARLSHRTFVETFADKNTDEDMQEYLARNCTAPVLAKELADPSSVFLVAECDSAAVGFAKLRRISWPGPEPQADTIEIHRLYVIKDMIGRNVGKTLMEKCLETAESENYETVWLGVWEHNDRAIAFYKRFGFQFFGSQIFQLGKDKQTDLLMRRSVHS